MTRLIDKNHTPEMFSGIARRYDLLNHVLSLNVDRLWRRALVREAGCDPDGQVLDACTGTGDVAIGFAHHLASGRVIGVDRSAEMLAVGQRKLAKARLDGRVRLLESDVLALPFADNTFDAVSIAFGLRNLPNYERGVDEMTRVLKPGGRLLVLEFCPPEGTLVLHAYNFYLRRVLPVVGGVISGSRSAYHYLAASIGDFLPRKRVVSLLASRGLRDVRARRLAGGIAYVYRGVKP